MIVIPVYDGVNLLDVTGPFEMFHWAGLKPTLVAEAAGEITFNGGLTCKVPAAFADAPECDALWTPGGAPDALVRLMNDPKRGYLDFLIRQSERVRYVASVCEGALLLCAAGLLDGYTVTTHWKYIPCLKRYENVRAADGHPRFYLDRNRLTGGGISSGLDEALELIRLLRGEAAAQHVQQITQYYPQPPVDSTIPPALECPLDLLQMR